MFFYSRHIDIWYGIAKLVSYKMTGKEMVWGACDLAFYRNHVLSECFNINVMNEDEPDYISITKTRYFRFCVLTFRKELKQKAPSEELRLKNFN